MDRQTVLVVDDERHIVYILRLKLEESGFEVIEARNGRDALEVIRSHPPDLVVTDYQMPIMDGLELAQRLGKDRESSTIPVLMLTARGHKIPSEELERTNVLDVMPKPFSPSRLVARIHELLTSPDANVAEASAA